MALWTQEVSVRWRTELSFYERRTHLLRAFEEFGSSAFRWTERAVGARLSDHVEAEIQATGADLRILTPKDSGELGRAALDIIFGELRPSDVVIAYVSQQYLLPLAMSFEEAAARSASELVPEVGPDGRALDWAVLLDGIVESLGTFKVEYGIIRRNEAEDRLNRVAGRMGGSPGGAAGVPPDLSDLPECAHFFDWHWFVGRPLLDDDLTGSTVRVWNDVTWESERLSDRVRDRFGLGQAERKEARA